MKATIIFNDGSVVEIDTSGWGGNPIVPHTFQYDTGNTVSEQDSGDAMTHIIPLSLIATITIPGGVGDY